MCVRCKFGGFCVRGTICRVPNRSDNVDRDLTKHAMFQRPFVSKFLSVPRRSVYMLESQRIDHQESGVALYCLYGSDLPSQEIEVSVILVVGGRTQSMEERRV